MVKMMHGNWLMIRKRHILAILVLMLAISACRNKTRQNEPVIYNDQPVTELSEPDTTSEFVQEDDSVIIEKPSTTSRSTVSPSSRSHSSGSYDNMRGFDPASENDMDDNGMSRYMENDDEEGWD